MRTFIGSRYGFDPVPASKLIPDLREQLRKPASVKEANELRRRLARALEEAARFAEAADAIAPEAVLPASYYDVRYSHMNSDALLWSTLVRRADTEALHQNDPRVLITVRRLLANIRGRRWNLPRVGGREWLSDEKVIERLAAIGPGALSCVFDDLEPRTISGADRSPFVEVIKRVGGLEDTPMLIETLATVTVGDRRGTTPAGPMATSLRNAPSWTAWRS